MEENQEATESKIEELALTAVLIVTNTGQTFIGRITGEVDTLDSEFIYLKQVYQVAMGPQGNIVYPMYVYNGFPADLADDFEFRFKKDCIALIQTHEVIDKTYQGILAQEKAARSNIQIVGGQPGQGGTPGVNGSGHRHPHRGHRR